MFLEPAVIKQQLYCIPAVSLYTSGLPLSVFCSSQESAQHNEDFFLSSFGLDVHLSGDGPLSEAAAIFASLPPDHSLFQIRRRFIDRAKRIDTVSRALFPLSFLVFNVFYWLTYKVLRNEDLHAVL